MYEQLSQPDDSSDRGVEQKYQDAYGPSSFEAEPSEVGAFVGNRGRFSPSSTKVGTQGDWSPDQEQHPIGGDHDFHCGMSAGLNTEVRKNEGSTEKEDSPFERDFAERQSKRGHRVKNNNPRPSLKEQVWFSRNGILSAKAINEMNKQ